MTGANKRKGDAFERQVLNYLNDLGLFAYRCFNAGQPADTGDLHVRGHRDVVLQCKNVREWRASEWTADAKAQAFIAGSTILDDPIGVVVIKRRGSTNPAHSYVLLELDDLARLIQEGDKP